MVPSSVFASWHNSAGLRQHTAPLQLWYASLFQLSHISSQRDHVSTWEEDSPLSSTFAFKPHLSGTPCWEILGPPTFSRAYASLDWLCQKLLVQASCQSCRIQAWSLVARLASWMLHQLASWQRQFLGSAGSVFWVDHRFQWLCIPLWSAWSSKLCHKTLSHLYLRQLA